jgi:hypothetical protein
VVGARAGHRLVVQHRSVGKDHRDRPPAPESSRLKPMR